MGAALKGEVRTTDLCKQMRLSIHFFDDAGGDSSGGRHGQLGRQRADYGGNKGQGKIALFFG